MKNIKYVYNPFCADFLIKHGGVCTGTGVNQSSKSIYYTFVYNQVQDAYKQWNVFRWNIGANEYKIDCKECDEEQGLVDYIKDKF